MAFAGRVPPRARVACWPVREVNGLVMVWHDIEKKPPTWEIPTVPESNQEEWTPYWRKRWQIRTHNHEMAENVAGELAVDCLGFGFSTHEEHGADIAKGIGKAFTREIARQLEEDKPIWEHKVYIEKPLLCDGDGPIGVFRRWCRTFYPDWYLEEAARAYRAVRETGRPEPMAGGPSEPS
jgi:hypothetical protein